MYDALPRSSTTWLLSAISPPPFRHTCSTIALAQKTMESLGMLLYDGSRWKRALLGCAEVGGGEEGQVECWDIVRGAAGGLLQGFDSRNMTLFQVRGGESSKAAASAVSLEAGSTL